MKNLKLICFLFVMLVISACSEYEPGDIDELFFTLSNDGKPDFKEYSAIDSVNKEVVFFEGFNNNAGKWFEGNNSTIGNQYDFHIRDGFYFMDYDNWGGDDAVVSKNIVGEIFSGNFEIETSVEFLDSHSDSEDDLGIIWNYFNNDNRPVVYYFKACFSTKVITIGSDNESQYTVWKTIEADKSPLKNSPFVKLTLRRIDNYYYFFINEVYVEKYRFQPIMYNEVGILVGNCGIRADYIQVSKILSTGQ